MPSSRRSLLQLEEADTQGGAQSFKDIKAKEVIVEHCDGARYTLTDFDSEPESSAGGLTPRIGSLYDESGKTTPTLSPPSDGTVTAPIKRTPIEPTPTAAIRSPANGLASRGDACQNNEGKDGCWNEQLHKELEKSLEQAQAQAERNATA